MGPAGPLSGTEPQPYLEIKCIGMDNGIPVKPQLKTYPRSPRQEHHATTNREAEKVTVKS
jgi:hypothetical protein